MKFAIPRGNDSGWGLLGTHLEAELRKLPSLPDTVILQATASGATFEPHVPFLRGRHNYAIAFFEDVVAARDNISSAEQWDHVFVGSTWNANIMRNAGFSRVTAVPQGVDHDVFKPIPEHKFPKDTFTVFSGGKFELRKGQDAVIAAMRPFMKAHPDVVLSVAWDNQCPATMDSMARSPYIRYEKRDTALATITATLEANGIDLSRVQIHPLMQNRFMADIYREADVAVFVGRAESRNQPALECMACGVPLIAMRQTAMRDILTDYVSVAVNGYRDPLAEGWMEPSVADLAGVLELSYSYREVFARMGHRAVADAKYFTWERMAKTIHRHIIADIQSSVDPVW